MWFHYFGYCEAGFNACTIFVVQITASGYDTPAQPTLTVLAFDVY
jgi:hypothetical protein